MTTNRNLLLTAATGALLALAGCTSSKAPGPNINGLVGPGAHTLTFSATVQDAVKVPVGGLEFTLVLPPGVKLATTSTGQVQPAGLRPVLTGTTALASGHLEQDPTQVALSVVVATQTAWTGPFLQLDFTVPPGQPVLTERQLQNLNANLASYKVVGLDPTGRTSMDLTQYVTTTLAVTR